MIRVFPGHELGTPKTAYASGSDHNERRTRPSGGSHLPVGLKTREPKTVYLAGSLRGNFLHFKQLVWEFFNTRTYAKK